MADHSTQWQGITSDSEILSTVSGLPLKLLEEPLDGNSFQYAFGKDEHNFVSLELVRLLEKRVIAVSTDEPGQIISPIFVRPKTDGGFRLILNLKKLNEVVHYQHFKMETLQSILQLVRPNAYMAKVDIKDAYYSVAIKSSDQKFLKFKFGSVLYKFLVLPNGYTDGPRSFTKLLKPPLATLRLEHITLASYIDDIFTIDKSKERCLDNVFRIVQQFQSLGFVIHPDKSNFLPDTSIEFLGFIIDSVTMTVTLTLDKKEKLREFCAMMLTKKLVSIRQIASLLGKFTSSLLSVPAGRLHFRALDKLKCEALRIHKGNFDKYVKLTDEAMQDIKWWHDGVMSSFAPICRQNTSLTMSTDASLSGWGACLDTGTRTGGFFSVEEKIHHINVLECKAVLFGLKSLYRDVYGQHIKVLVDNSATVGGINKMGSSKSREMNEQIKTVWNWILSRNNWITAAHIPGIDNTAADQESRRTSTSAE